ncbi:MAG TPA: translation initiation factor IF-2 [Thermoanaerobaculia bacterium]|nr:translation initiation factor IF-2 [Thermoanaerobaculia bacterium]
MGKVRVQDLARMMGISNQDLVFKLKSIGVRVEGDDAHIDTDIISAILQGKKLPHPREVILRDEPAAPESPSAVRRRAPAVPPVRRAPANPLRPARPRTLIQKVEPRIQTLPASERAPAVPASPGNLAGLHGSPGGAQFAPGQAHPAAPSQGHTISSPLAPPSYHPGAALPSHLRAPGARSGPASSAHPPGHAAAPAFAGAAAEGAAARSAAAAGHAVPLPVRGVTLPGGAPASAAGALAKAAAAPAGAAEGLRRRGERVIEVPKGADKTKKKAKGGKKPGPRTVEDEDLKAYKGTIEDIEETADEGAESPGGRRRRRAARKEEEDKEGGKLLTFKKAPPLGTVMIGEGMTLREFAEKLGVKVRDLIKALFDRGIMANINQVLEPELAQQLAKDLGVDTMVVSFEEEEQLREELLGTRPGEQPVEGKVPRAPVVTIMGHVDHGKTSLLDAIRSSKVTETEFGGITQHIGAYHVDVHGKQVVFVDTPGHEAFTMMRARGARVTDIVVLVVAADDGVMPQTIEAIDHARAARVPIVVAINKIDKANANLDRVKRELADRGLAPEDWGGDTVMVPVSALKKEGIQELLEMILLTADILELKANPEIQAQGAVLEARKEVGRGIVATVLVQNGTLRVGDVFVSGATFGRVRSMSDDLGQRPPEAGPSTPVEVTGFNDIPDAGDLLQVVDDESRARGIAEFRSQELRRRDLNPTQGRLSLEQLFDRIQDGEVKELPVVLKADVQGSVEVLRDALAKVNTDKVRLQVIHAGVGAISTNDVLLASASKAVVVGFNVRPERSASELAEKEEVDIRLHTVIYELIDELRKAMTGLLEPTFREVAAGRAEVRETFKVPKVGTVAGCHVVEGTIPRTAAVRLLRDNRVVFEGKIASLRRFKDDVSEVRSGFDCGIGLERFQDVKPGDFIEAYVREEVAPVL